jgi:hypothetical protein
MKNEANKNLKQALLYLCLFILFRTVFILIIPYYINASSQMHGPIDARIADCKFFDAGYVEQAKNGGYNIAEYFELYFPLDLAFPVLYTLMFLTVLETYKNKKFNQWLRYIVFAGMIFDYLENFTFAVYLKSSTNLSSLVAFFTTLKGVLFAINFLAFVPGFFWLAILALKKNKVNPAEII